jgi:hypothetical protein
VRVFSMIVPAFDGDPDSPAAEQWAAAAAAAQLTTLRLELLSPSVLLAIFDGIPELVWCEEPHHNIEFAVQTKDDVSFFLDRHGAAGQTEPGPQVPVPVRAANRRVVAVAELRNRLAALTGPAVVPQTGSAAFAIELLDYPWRQRFQGAESERRVSSGAFVPKYEVASVITDQDVRTAVTGLLS